MLYHVDILLKEQKNERKKDNNRCPGDSDCYVVEAAVILFWGPYLGMGWADQ